MSKRRKGYPSETHVKGGHRFIKGGEIELTDPSRRALQDRDWSATIPARSTEPHIDESRCRLYVSASGQKREALS